MAKLIALVSIANAPLSPVRDPAFTIVGHTRYVALARILDEIRFFAGRVEPLTPPWWSGSARAAEVSAESEEHELAIFETIGDAVLFSVRYLSGTALREIEIPRTKPTSTRYQGHGTS